MKEFKAGMSVKEWLRGEGLVFKAKRVRRKRSNKYLPSQRHFFDARIRGRKIDRDIPEIEA